MRQLPPMNPYLRRKNLKEIQCKPKCKISGFFPLTNTDNPSSPSPYVGIWRKYPHSKQKGCNHTNGGNWPFQPIFVGYLFVNPLGKLPFQRKRNSIICTFKVKTKRVSKPANKTKIPAANAVAFSGVQLLNRSQMSIPIAKNRRIGR